MFSNVGGSVRLGNTRVVFQDEIDWAIKFLRKDDRIVWYLSILQKITFKILESKSRYQSKKWKAKFRRKLGDFEQDRIIAKLFKWDVNSQPVDAIDTLEPYHTVELDRP